MYWRAKRKNHRRRAGTADRMNRRAWFPKVIFLELLLCFAAVALMTGVFVIKYQISPWIAVSFLPFALLSGIILVVLDKWLPFVYYRCRDRIGMLQTVFLSFFVSLLGGIVVFPLLLGHSMSLVLGWFGLGKLILYYSRWAAGLGIVAAFILWLRYLLGKSSARIRS